MYSISDIYRYVYKLHIYADDRAGLRVLWINQEEYELEEVAYFDVFPSDTQADFNLNGGTWSNYPYFKSSE